MGGEAPGARDLPFAGDYIVESPVVAVLTRFVLRRPWHLLSTYLSYRWLTRRVRRVAPDGLLKAVFLVENPTTCWSPVTLGGPVRHPSFRDISHGARGCGTKCVRAAAIQQ